MNGLSMLFWSVVYSVYGFVRYPGRKWEHDCEFCDEQFRARSKNMVMTRYSLHVHFTEDEEHPDGPEDYDGDWQNSDAEPTLLANGGWST